MNDLHGRFAEWLAGGAEGDPPRDVALHASGCQGCLDAAAALDSLRAIDVGAAPMPPRGVVASDNLLTGWRVARVGAGAAAVVVLAAVAVIGSSSLGDRGQPVASIGGGATSGGGVLAGVPSSTPATLVPSATASGSPTPAPTRSATPTDRPEPTRAPTPAPTVRPPVGTPAPAPATPVPTPAPPTATPAPTQPPPTSPPPTATPAPTPTDVPSPSPTPSPTPAPDDCADGIDNDGDTLIDAADPGCSTPSANEDAA